MLKYEHVNVAVSRTNILNDINITFPKGQITTIIGPNGCGKTTLLQCLNGCSKVTAGTITVDNESILSGLARMKDTSTAAIIPIAGSAILLNVSPDKVPIRKEVILRVMILYSHIFIIRKITTMTNKTNSKSNSRSRHIYIYIFSLDFYNSFFSKRYARKRIYQSSRYTKMLLYPRQDFCDLHIKQVGL